MTTFANTDLHLDFGHHSPPNFTPSSYELNAYKRTRSGSISRRMRSASDLEEKGLIDRSQKGALKDLIIRGDEQLLTALDRWTSEGDHSDLENLIRSGALNDAAAMAALDVDGLVDDLELNFLQLHSGDADGGIPDMPAVYTTSVVGNRGVAPSAESRDSGEVTSGSYQFDSLFEDAFGGEEDVLGNVGFGLSPFDGLDGLGLGGFSPLLLVKEEDDGPAVTAKAESTCSPGGPAAQAPVEVKVERKDSMSTAPIPPVVIKMEPMADMSMLGMGASGFSSCGPTGMARSAAMDIPNAKHPTCGLSMPMAPPAPPTSCAAVKVHPPSAAETSTISCTSTQDVPLTTASATATSTVPTAGTVVTTAAHPPQETSTQPPVTVKVEDTSAFAVGPQQAQVTSVPSPAPSPAAAVKAQASAPAKPVPIKKDEPTGKKHYVGAYSPESRRLRLERFWEKKKNRIWQRKVKYDVRKEFAESRIRVKGRFVKKEDEAILTSLLGCVPPPMDAPRPEPALTGYSDPSLMSYGEAPAFDYPPPPPINYTEAGANGYTDLGPSGYTGTGF